MNIVPSEDIAYLAQQSTSRLNMVLSGMTALMNDTDNKVATMESQSWFQRMVKTVTGKNKLTQKEIQKNHDKLNAYMSEAIAELYNQNCIDHQIMISLGNQINEIYADHLQLKQMLGAFAKKLNEKIESVDNFHMLVEEINQGMHSKPNQPMISVISVLSMMDKRILTDKRKCDIILQAMRNREILNTNHMTLEDCLLQVLQLDSSEVGRVYMELHSIKDHYFVSMLVEAMERKYFLNEEQWESVDNREIVANIMRETGYSASSIVSTEDIIDDFLPAKQDLVNGLVPIAELQIEDKLAEAEKEYINCNFDRAFSLFRTLAKKGSGRAMYFMGVYYSQGYGNVNIDEDMANEWNVKGKDVGDPLATFNLLFDWPDGSNPREDTFRKVFQQVTQLAQCGDVFAQYELGCMYSVGYGIKADTQKALHWWTKSAQAGVVSAMNRLGKAYFDGFDGEEDYTSAKKWFQEASDCGNDKATTNLGIIAVEENDFVGAVNYFRKAAENGYADAQNRLGVRYSNGEGVEQDDALAFQWFMKAAEQGHKKAQSNVGNGYHYGNGVEIDHEKAKEWLRKSADQDYDVAKNNLYEWYGEGTGSSSEDTTETITLSVGGSGCITSSTFDSIKTACEVFVMTHDASQYDVSYKLKCTLGIEYQEVYLAHDDTIFKSGKNGFAITEEGIYCRELFGAYTNHVSFEELSRADSIYVSNSNIYADGEMIGYYSGSDSVRRDLKDLFEEIALYVQTDLM